MKLCTSTGAVNYGNLELASVCLAAVVSHAAKTPRTNVLCDDDALIFLLRSEVDDADVADDDDTAPATAEEVEPDDELFFCDLFCIS